MGCARKPDVPHRHMTYFQDFWNNNFVTGNNFSRVLSVGILLLNPFVCLCQPPPAHDSPKLPSYQREPRNHYLTKPLSPHQHTDPSKTAFPAKRATIFLTAVLSPTRGTIHRTAMAGLCQVWNVRGKPMYRTDRCLSSCQEFSRSTRGTGWDHLARRMQNLVLGRSDGRYGKRFSFVYRTGWEWDGEVRSHLVDGTG